MRNKETIIATLLMLGCLIAQAELVPGRPTDQENQKFQPVLEDGVWYFQGRSTATLPDAWPNVQQFSAKLDFMMERTDVEQTLLLVTGSWQLRIVPGAEGTELVFYLYEGGKLKQVRIGPVEPRVWNSVEASVSDKGEPVLVLNGKSVSGQVLSAGLDPYNVYPQVFVGSANPTKYRRPLTGQIKNISITTK